MAIINGSNNNEFVHGTSSDDTLEGFGGADTLYGAGGDDIYVWSLGDGNDLINNYDISGQSNETLQLTDVASTDVVLTRVGNNLEVEVNGSETIIINDHFLSHSTLETIQFTDISWVATDIERAVNSGSDFIHGTSSDDTLEGFGGADTLYGAGGDDIYVWSLGDGNDLINNYDISGQSNETLQLTDVASTDVVLTRVGNNLEVEVNGSETIIINDHFLSHSTLETIQFTDISWVATDIERAVNSGSDFIHGTSSDDTLEGFGGADTLYGAGGDDIYVWSLGDGNDLINNYDISGQSNETLQLTDVASTDVVLTRVGNNLEVEVNGSETIIINDHFLSHSTLETIQFTDISWVATDIERAVNSGSDFIHGTSSDDTLEGFGGADTLYGAGGDDIYVWSLGDGNDLINNYDISGQSNETLQLTDVASTDVVLTRVGNNLEVEVNGSETIIINDHFLSHSTLETIQFTDISWVATDIERAVNSGSDFIHGTSSDDTLEGFGGADTLYGAGGDDIYVWSLGDGNDLINNYDISGQSNETLQLTDVASTDVVLTRVGNNLEVEVNGSETIIINDHFLSHSTLETIQFTDISLSAAEIETIITPPPVGSYVIMDAPGGYQGDAEHQTYELDVTDGLAVSITDAGDNTLLLKNTSLEGVAFNYVGDDLSIDLDSGLSSILLPGQLSSDVISTVIFEDAQGVPTIYSMAELSQLVPQTFQAVGESYFMGNDVGSEFFGDSQGSNDTFIGGTGGDVFDAFGGNDVVVGGGGNDTYYVYATDQDTGDHGSDLIIHTNTGGVAEGEVIFGDITQLEDATVSRVGDDLMVVSGVQGTQDYHETTLQNYFTPAGELALITFGEYEPISLDRAGIDATFFPIDGDYALTTGDIIVDVEGNDTYTLDLTLAQTSDANTVIDDTTGLDVLNILGPDPLDVEFYRIDKEGMLAEEGITNDDLVIYINVDGYYDGDVVIKNYFAAGGENTIESIVIDPLDGISAPTVFDFAAISSAARSVLAADNVVPGAGPGELIAGTSADEVLVGGNGDDVLMGGGGNDEYEYSYSLNAPEINHDTIDNRDPADTGTGVPQGTLYIEADDTEITSIFAEQYFAQSGMDLVITVSPEQTVTVAGYFDPATPSAQFEFIKFDSQHGEVEITPADVLSLISPSVIDASPTAAMSDITAATDGFDIYTWSLGAGHDSIDYGDYATPTKTTGSDLIDLSSMSASDVTMYQSGSDLIIESNLTDDSLTLTGYYDNPHFVESIAFSSPQGGSEFIAPPSALNVYIDSDPMSPLAQFSSSDDTIIETTDGDHTFYTGDANDQVQVLSTSGTQTISTARGDDLIVAQAESDYVINGGEGSDTYLVTANANHVMIMDDGAGDSLAGNALQISNNYGAFTGVNDAIDANRITFIKSGNDLIVAIDDEAMVDDGYYQTLITIENQYAGSGEGIQTIMAVVVDDGLNNGYQAFATANADGIANEGNSFALIDDMMV